MNTITSQKTDTSEMRNSYEELKEIETRYRLITENSADVIWVMDLKEQRFKYVSPSVKKLRGYTPEEVMAQPVSMALTEESARRIYELLADSIPRFLAGDESKNTSTDEVDQPCKDGSIVHTEVTTTITLNEQGEIEIVGVTRDITERKHIQEALRESEEKFHLLLNSAAEAIYGLDLEGNCTFANEACLKVLGYDREKELIGKNMHNLIHHSYNDGSVFPIHECRIYKAFLSESKSHVDDEVIWKKDGTCFPAEYWSYPMYRKGKIIGAVVTFMDITERRQSELQLQKFTEELKDLNQTKDKFFSIIAHDLRSPFTGLLGYSQILAENYTTLPEEEKLDLIKSIEELSGNTFKLLNNLLEWSRIHTGKMAFSPEKLDLYIELYPTISLQKQIARNKKIELTYSIDNSVSVFADKNMLQTITRNLISNSIKFTNPGGRILVTSQKNGNCMEVSVTDTGVGIKEERLNKLFKIESTISTKGTADEEGTGLGLLLCREMAERLGGRLWAESVVGKGSAFHFTIPLSC